MDYPSITRLYKYASWRTRTTENLVDGKLWFALPGTFNDPFDCTLPNHSVLILRRREAQAAKRARSVERLQRQPQDRDIGSRIRAVHERYLQRGNRDQLSMAQQFAEGHNTLQSFLHTFGVLSLSATAKSLLMWSHYGDQHKGICFEFERSPLDRLGREAKPVIYSMQREGEEAQKKHPHASPLFLKYSGWRYEREWRMVENDGGRLYDFPAKLMAVICGARMTEQNLAEVSSNVASFNASRGETVMVKRAEMNPLTYSLAIRPVGAAGPNRSERPAG